MIEGKQVLAIIPARGGSKRLPGKNTKLLEGKPLIAYTIEAAIGASFVDRIVVSTECEQIAKIAEQYGSKPPFLRPMSLAQDDSKTEAVIMHILKWLKEVENKEYDILLLLQPTSPLRTQKHINAALTYFCERKARSVISVCETEHNPLWTMRLSKNLKMEKFFSSRKEKDNKCRKKAFKLNGAIYICRRKDFVEFGSFFLPKRAYAFVMTKYESVDIDDGYDWRMCEFFMREKINC